MSDETPDDRLLKSLRDLPVHAAPKNGAARAAFVGAFAPWHVRVAAGVGRGLVPVALASIVGVYLTWAFGMALSVMN
ncbi:MAG: hypothetical protein KIT84_28115 [Labilithrix sp.]|nr:hypothetical protein [Labilithrix sp.]MCW5814924.1 hypothetical protein [Labilithrix sp.]